jgi:D-arabinose 1-dehydrogenase-like Zn-dependent alcohol dehydrogenase
MIGYRSLRMTHRLEAANEALARLRDGKVEGAAVLVVGELSPAGSAGT